MVYLKKKELVILNQSAKEQIDLLENNKNIKELELLEDNINNFDESKKRDVILFKKGLDDEI